MLAVYLDALAKQSREYAQTMANLGELKVMCLHAVAIVIIFCGVLMVGFPCRVMLSVGCFRCVWAQINFTSLLTR